MVLENNFQQKEAFVKLKINFIDGINQYKMNLCLWKDLIALNS